MTHTEMVPHPVTFQALALTQLTDDQLAQVLDEAQEWERASWRSFKRAVQDEVLARMDRDASWTVRTDGFKLTGDSPALVDIDVEELSLRLTDAGAPEELIERVIKERVVEYIDRRELNALKKLPQYRKAIEACERPTTKPRRVSVSRVIP